jgi:hypothetical protein
LAVKSILDFIYLAQYGTHNNITLGYMEDALQAWETNRSFFIQTGICEDFNIPKFHSLLHYMESIKLFGTTDNYNTEMFEWLHIDFAKHGWHASNFHDEFPQMISWLSRQTVRTRGNSAVFWSPVTSTSATALTPSPMTRRKSSLSSHTWTAPQ